MSNLLGVLAQRRQTPPVNAAGFRSGTHSRRRYREGNPCNSRGSSGSDMTEPATHKEKESAWEVEQARWPLGWMATTRGRGLDGHHQGLQAGGVAWGSEESFPRNLPWGGRWHAGHFPLPLATTGTPWLCLILTAVPGRSSPILRMSEQRLRNGSMQSCHDHSSATSSRTQLMLTTRHSSSTCETGTISPM